MNQTQPKSTAASPNGGTSRRHPFFSQLRVRLLALVLLAILPALGLVVYTAWEQRRAAMKEALLAAQRVVSFAASSQKQHVEASKQLLATLTQLKEVRPDHASEAEVLFRNLLQVHAVYANIGGIDADGYLFASALPHTNRVYVGDRSYFQVARDTLKFAVGEYQTGRVSGKPTMNLAHPIKDPATGQFLGVVFVALDLAWLTQLAARAELPDGSTLTAVDRNGTVLVRYALNATMERDWVGQSITNRTRVTMLMRQGQDLMGVATGLDGVKRLYTSTPLSRTGGLVDAHVIVGIPVSVAYAAAHHTLVQNLIFLGIVSVLALGAAWIASDVFVLRQVRGLVSAARQMRHGDLSARSGVGHAPGEIGQLAQSFDEMASTLEGRVADLQRAEAELKGFNEELEQRVVERTLELKRSNEDLEQFAYVASHDLQEPLRMINNYLQLLQQRYQQQLDAPGREFVGFALDGAKRMQQLIQDLLTYSRVGTHGKEMVTTSCAEALEHALANLRMAITEAQAEITHESLPALRGDPIQLTQLFQNLVGNAIKFRGSGPPRVQIGAQRKGADWEFHVADTGIGIAQQDFERIFVVFQHLHSSEKYPGTGIGLAVCKKIVERHGGRIWVESKLGKGTTFRFTLPAQES
ncbi:MAG TPA: ATP-binding protein [Verrucomicrobiae bacterium]|nr:ATP-binding protein [Verrucomicrobiae bacterium]